MTSYSRHAPVGGKQGGIQPGCNQYWSLYILPGFCRVVISSWIHQLLPQKTGLPLVRCPHCGHGGEKTKRGIWRRGRWRWGTRGYCYDWAKRCSTPQLQHKHQHLFWVRVLGGPRRAITQVSSDRLTMSTAKVFHSQTEAACWLCNRGSR